MNKIVKDINNVGDFKRLYKNAEAIYVHFTASMDKSYNIYSFWVLADKLEIKKNFHSIPDSTPLDAFFKYDEDTDIGSIYISQLR